MSFGLISSESKFFIALPIDLVSVFLLLLSAGFDEL